MDEETKKRLRRMVIGIIENVYSDLEAAVKASEGLTGHTLEGDDFIEPVYNHLIDDARHKFGVSSDVYARVCKFDREVTELIREEARKTVGR